MRQQHDLRSCMEFPTPSAWLAVIHVHVHEVTHRKPMDWCLHLSVRLFLCLILLREFG